MLKRTTVQLLDKTELDNLAALCVLTMKDTSGEWFEATNRLLTLLMDELERKEGIGNKTESN